MTIATKYFNEVELGALGLVTPEVAGVFDLAADEVARTWIPGRYAPSDVSIRRSLVDMQLHCVVSDTTHAGLTSRLYILRGYLSPGLGFCTFAIENRKYQRTWAKCKGIPVAIEQRPYGTLVVEFDLAFERYPYWEDLSAISVNNPASINNSGDLVTYPIYTCTVTDTLGTGLTFTVDGKTFSYTGALAGTDVLVVETELPDVLLNGTRDFGNVSSIAEFPPLSVGVNIVGKSSDKFTLNVSYRRRYE